MSVVKERVHSLLQVYELSYPFHSVQLKQVTDKKIIYFENTTYFITSNIVTLLCACAGKAFQISKVIITGNDTKGRLEAYIYSIKI